MEMESRVKLSRLAEKESDIIAFNFTEMRMYEYCLLHWQLP